MSKAEAAAARPQAWARVLQWLTEREDEMIASVRELVIRESPTHDKQACDKLCSHLAGEFECLGGQVQIHRQRTAGNHLQVDFAGASKRASRCYCWDISIRCMTWARCKPCRGASIAGGSTGREFST